MQQDQERILSVERVAAVLATIQHYGEAHSAEVLARSGLDEATWQASLAAAAGKVAGEDRPGGLAGRAFADSLCKTADRLRAEQPPLSALGTRPAEGGGENLDEPTQQRPVAIRALIALPEAVLPMGPQPEDRWGRYRGGIDDELTADVVALGPALPFAAAPPEDRHENAGHFEGDDETRLGTVADLGRVVR